MAEAKECEDEERPFKRFKKATNDEEFQEITKGYVPENTKKSTASAIRVFNEWKFSREDEQPPGNLLTDGNPEQLNYWIPRFVNEARESDRQPYPPRTINQLLAGIQRHMLTENHLLPKFSTYS
uniref:QRICH1-like domain-containing protein n=1 Tax=Amphimedon queenslandica TaxID=400682 RepID=A0A1X7U6Q7_AMPQE